MSLPTNPAFEKAVIADCENDLPRLVYADWLDENGDPARAAFIRAQCGLWEKNPADPDYPDLLELRREAIDGLKGRRLGPKVPPAVGFFDNLYDPDRDDFGGSYHRGFPFVAKEPYVDGGMPYAKAEAYADRLAAALPKVIATTTLRGLYLTGPLQSQYPRILPADACGAFTALFGGNQEADFADTLVRSPIRTNLRWLELNVTDGHLAALSKADFPNLRRWDGRFECDPKRLAKLLRRPWFARLERVKTALDKDFATSLVAALAGGRGLHTLEVDVWRGTLETLNQPGGFRSLSRLHLASVDFEKQNSEPFAAAEFPALTAFEVKGDLRNDHLKPLLKADWFAGLRVLKLDCGDLGDQSLAGLGKTPAAKNLRSLTLDTPNIGKKTFASLFRDFPALTTLNLYATLKKKMTPADLAAALTALSLPNLRHLNLSGWPLGDEGAAALAGNALLAGLTRLDLSYCQVGAAGVRAILQSPHLQRLVYLNLSSSEGGEEMAALTDSGVLPRLAHCWLPRGGSKDLEARLVSARGKIFV
jgi:uncharacterized protein (TIGR02996 family)